MSSYNRENKRCTHLTSQGDIISKPYRIRRITHQALYASPQPTISVMWALSHMWSISNTSPHMWATPYPRTTFSSNTMFGRDNSSHNHPVGPLVWTNPRIMSVDLHTHLMRFTLSQNHKKLGGLPTKHYASP